MRKVPIDTIFVCDTTSSMGGFIDAAKRFMQSAVQEISKSSGLEVFTSIIEYRDHPPQDTLPARLVGSRLPVDQVSDVVRKMNIAGGGDTAESGFDGVVMIEKLPIPESLKVACIIGDAPLHGTEAARGHSSGGWIDACGCGLTKDHVRLSLERSGINLIGIPVSAHGDVARSFNEICDKVLEPTRDVFRPVIEEAKVISMNYKWSVETLLPVLEKDPRISNKSLVDMLGVGLDRIQAGINILNTFGYTAKFNIITA